MLFFSVIDSTRRIFHESFSRGSLIRRVDEEGNGISFNRWNDCRCQRAKYQIEVACTGGHVIPDDPTSFRKFNCERLHRC